MSSKVSKSSKMEPFRKCFVIHRLSSEKCVDFKNHNFKSLKSSHELLGAENGAIPKMFRNTSFFIRKIRRFQES